MKYFCNPLNLPYKYLMFPKDGKVRLNREAADPSLVLFGGRYYMFPSMTAGFYVSDNLVSWEYHSLDSEMPIYDYAPDVCVMGDYLYFSASRINGNCSFYRTKDPINHKFEELKGTFPFFDPNLFADDDGKIYFYWGASNATPIYGIELDKNTMHPVGEPTELIHANEKENGFERFGENHIPPRTEEEIDKAVVDIVKMFFPGTDINDVPAEAIERMRIAAGNDTFIEGAWMTKYNGVYYLQYAVAGTQFNIYNDAVYVSNKPLGPFKLAKNNPYSYKPGGFALGAGHGSTLEDKNGQWWHVSTMVISVNQQFERRLGLWQAGFDKDGELFCDQRYGDWVMNVSQKPWDDPEWMLLSYKKAVRASSGINESYVTDESIRTWWKAEKNTSGEWIEVDLGAEYDVRAIQINFADDELFIDEPKNSVYHGETDKRIIDTSSKVTRWILEGSIDGKIFFPIEDKSNIDTDLPHDLIVRDEGIKCRFVKLTVVELPYNQVACVSGLRVFGNAEGEYPAQANMVEIDRQSNLDILVRWKDDKAAGHNVLWGYDENKLYHSCMVFGASEQEIGALIKGQSVFVRVDSFNECGITKGNVQFVA